ncbi:unnamed protein product [Soboliphyme baturini]|uniref:Proteoglycan 4-like n=1 Tax=Soboliphyme baturini TaxID=241478 RepID=A0A183J757_9BILA|nr:unnamed protein product [Soboliphyme baturini]
MPPVPVVASYAVRTDMKPRQEPKPAVVVVNPDTNVQKTLPEKIPQTSTPTPEATREPDRQLSTTTPLTASSAVHPSISLATPKAVETTFTEASQQSTEDQRWPPSRQPLPSSAPFTASSVPNGIYAPLGISTDYVTPKYESTV